MDNRDSDKYLKGFTALDDETPQSENDYSDGRVEPEFDPRELNLMQQKFEDDVKANQGTEPRETEESQNSGSGNAGNQDENSGRWTKGEETGTVRSLRECVRLGEALADRLRAEAN